MTNDGLWSWILRNKIKWNFDWNTLIFIKENVFEKVIWKITAFCRGLRVLIKNLFFSINSSLLLIMWQATLAGFTWGQSIYQRNPHNLPGSLFTKKTPCDRYRNPHYKPTTVCSPAGHVATNCGRFHMGPISISEHYTDVIMSEVAFQITSPTIVY